MRGIEQDHFEGRDQVACLLTDVGTGVGSEVTVGSHREIQGADTRIEKEITTEVVLVLGNVECSRYQGRNTRERGVAPRDRLLHAEKDIAAERRSGKRRAHLRNNSSELNGAVGRHDETLIRLSEIENQSVPTRTHRP